MTAATRTVADFGPTAAGHLWKRVQRGATPADCWLWTGRKTEIGYGEFTYRSTDGRTRHIRAHRAVWELTNGPLPDRAPLDHTCENRLCVNPDHLEPVTPRQNAYHVLTRRSGGRHIWIPDELWDLAEAGALRCGLDLHDVITECLRKII